MSSGENVNFLVEMGFPKERAEQAEASTRGQGLQAAIDWLLSHPEGSSGQTVGGALAAGAESATLKLREDSSQNEKGTLGEVNEGESAGGAESGAPAQALSLVCEECGKQLRSEMEAQTHAARSGHQKFAESAEAVRPLTEEEKRKQMELLQQKLAERRLQREETEKEEAKQREKIRRKMGKDVTDAKQKHEMAEIKRIAEEKRREKKEEKLYRQKLKEKIAQDRANMKAAQASNMATTTSPPVDAQPKPEAVKQEAKEYDTCRIQFRFPNGTTKTQAFKPTDPLSEVNYFATVNGYDGDSPLRLMTTFPRKTFGPAEMDMTLKELGLVPSCVIVVSKT